jgi:hypothetical protein
MPRSSKSPGPRKERGAIAIIVGLSLAVLVGAVGLAVDGGRLYVTKTELQNAADACALAASYELTGNPIAPEAFTRGTAAGVTVATQNRVGFQGALIDAADVTVEYGTSLASGSTYVPATAPPAGNSKYVRCTIAETGIAPWFMQVLGAGDQTVRAFATATLAPSQSNCAIPLGLCTAPGSSAPDYDYVVGDWYTMNFQEAGNSSTNLTGNFRWVDFDPSSPTPGCSGGGAQELACILKGAGQCNLPPAGPNTCSTSGNSSPDPGCVGQTGQIQSLEAAFNTRFGIYKGSEGPTTAPPDFTGFAYNSTTWTLGRNAYGGTSAGANNFTAARQAHTPAQSTYSANGNTVTAAGNYVTYGADRRLVVVPLVDCSSFVGSQHAPVRGYACILMTEPYNKVGSNVTVTAEYLGRSDVSGSPCATSGSVGNASSSGPLVPALVQ